MAPQTSARTLSLLIPERAHSPLKVQPRDSAKSRGPASEMLNGCQIRVLVVVSDRQNGDWAIAELEKAGYDTRADFALSRQEFGVLVGGVSYDVILAEFTLRGWTGLDVLSTTYDRGIETPVIIINAADNDERAGGWIEAGAADYITKGNPRRLPLAVRRGIADAHALHSRDSQEQLVKKRGDEQRVRDSETKFRLLAEASFDAVVIAVDGVIIESNYGLPNMLGYTVDEIIGRPVLEFVAEESRALVECRMREEVVGIYEFTGKHKSGRKVVLEAAARNYQIHGQAARLTAVRDITEKRSLENQFRQAQKMEAVGRLAGGVAHDFNNLLTVIMAYTQLIEDEVGPTSPLLEDLNEIAKASLAAASLTKQLLAFSRKQVIEPKLVFLEKVVVSAENMLRRLIGEDIDLVTTPSGAPCPVILDPGQLDQVIMNLAVNSRDAMPTGGKLTLETAVVDLDVDYANSHWPAVAGRYAMLAVSDSGIGMSAETQARIFEPFFTTKESGKGTGLGLATVYGIVKQNNGFIWVYSEIGHGTTFKLYFPIATGVERTEMPCEDIVQHNGTETVLIVEDSPAVRSAARRILQRCGYKVLEAPNGKAGMSLARKKNLKIDLLLTDVIMPEMSGREVAVHFAELRPETKVLYMSGYTDDAVVRQGILQEGIAYLQKPFTAFTLSARVRRVLNESCNGERSTN
jgi:two-component system, cell cycle sensor histidine kinase and response regulator CckA